MKQLRNSIVSWLGSRENNAIFPGAALPAFDAPLVGAASGADPLFSFLKEDIGADFYWTPLEAFQQAFPEEQVRAEELRVISWILPHTENTRKAHRQAGDLPSIEWSRGRHYGEKVNVALRRFVVDCCMAQGQQACAPMLLPQWTEEVSVRYGFASRWSERHAAYVCGLGTFGLSDGLITPVGKAMRTGSAVVRMDCEPTPRLYTAYNEWCLSAAGKNCRACIKRCPAGAISATGHDKVACKKYIRQTTAVHVQEQQLGFRVNSCGLCQTKVPCEKCNPLEKLKNR